MGNTKKILDTMSVEQKRFVEKMMRYGFFLGAKPGYEFFETLNDKQKEMFEKCLTSYKLGGTSNERRKQCKN